MSTRRRLTGRIQVALPPGEAFRLFTPRGEQDWAHGWDPRFPSPAVDDSEPGTVFETSAHGDHTIWLVTGREAGERISYARVTPGHHAGTVSVTISPAGPRSEVEVTYELTALTGLAEHKLAEFADGYPAYLRTWEDAIAALLRDGNADATGHHRRGESRGDLPSSRESHAADCAAYHLAGQGGVSLMGASIAQVVSSAGSVVPAPGRRPLGDLWEVVWRTVAELRNSLPVWQVPGGGGAGG